MLVSNQAPLRANESVFLQSKGEACKTLASETEFNAWHCPGPAGYGFTYNDSVMNAALSFTSKGQGNPTDTAPIEWAPAGQGIGSRIEWRMKDGKPVSAIIGRWRSSEDGTGSKATEEFLIVKLTASGGCAVGIIGALSVGALSTARDIADARAMEFRCGIDQPVLNVGADSVVSTLDHGFSEHETLEHNRSLVELIHSQFGAIEIRYREPRPSLKVVPGTLLFRGQERSGEFAGSAFLFKVGCEPAEYLVTGRRTDGVLVLEGKAPRRDPKSCAVTVTSKPSLLVFQHEPVVEATVAAQAERRVIAQCGQCLPASIKTLEAIGTDHAHVTAEVTIKDVLDYCENLTSGSDRLAVCLNDNSAEIGKVQEARANCSDLTVRPSSGGKYKFFGIENDYGGPTSIWMDLASGRIECKSRSCNGATATAHFTLLCPHSTAGWMGHPY